MSSSDAPNPFGDARGGRKLVAVVHMDMVGYSRLIGLDDADTLSRLKALRRSLIEPSIDAHGGRLIQTAGDAFLIVFDSIDGAMHCALNVQRLMPAYDGDHPPERRIAFRIGIEIGDVITDGADVHGDGVNVAVRLQSKCPPGGIYVSRAVRDHVRAQPDLAFESIGALSLKNIARPVETFLLRSNGASTQTGTSAPPASRPSLVVLPFDNLSSDPADDRLAEAITDDLTTELTRASGVSVLARNAALAADGNRVHGQQTGDDRAVRYALHGSVRRSGQQIWVNTQLIDAASGAHIHADRFGTDHASLTANHDEVISRLVRMVRLALVADGGKRLGKRTEADLALTDLLVHGRAAFLQPVSRESYATAREYFERALTIDPELVEAQTTIAMILIANILDGWSSSPQEDQARAEQLLRKAITHDANSPRAHSAMALLRRLQNRLEDSQIEWEITIALDPHNPMAFCQLGLVLTYLGRLDAAIANIEKGIWLSPQEPGVAIAYHLLGHCRLLTGHVDDAIELFRKAHARNPGLYYNHLLLAAAFGLAGKLDEARKALAETTRLKPEFGSVRDVKEAHPWVTGRQYLDLAESTLFLGLRKAGMPDD